VDSPAPDRQLLRWSEALAAIARTGLGFTESLYERERFEEILHVAADIKVVAHEGVAMSPTPMVWSRVARVGGEGVPATSHRRWRWERRWATTTASSS